MGKFIAQMFGDGMFGTGAIPKKPAQENTQPTAKDPGTVPPADSSNQAAQAERDRAAEEERLKWLRGRSSTVATSEQGDLSAPNLAAKSLLGT